MHTLQLLKFYTCSFFIELAPQQEQLWACSYNGVVISLTCRLFSKPSQQVNKSYKGEKPKQSRPSLAVKENIQNRFLRDSCVEKKECYNY